MFEGAILELAALIGIGLTSLGSAIAYIGGVVLNYSIQFGIVNFAQFGNSPGVLVSWSVLRDIANIGLIFGFLAIGIATILGIQRYGAKALLPKLIIVALILNFSLFITRFSIDVSHILATAVLNQTGALQQNCENEEDRLGEFRADCNIRSGLAANFMRHFGVQSIFDADADSLRGLVQEGSAGQWISLGVLGFIFLTVVGFVFLAAGMILFFRIGMLFVLMLTSALALVAYILPRTRRFFDWWINRLIKELLVAPAMMLMFAITLLFLNSTTAIILDLQGAAEQPSFADVILGGGADTISVVVVFIITLVLFLMSIKIGVDSGGLGAKFATRTAARGTMGGLSFAGKNTIGRGARFTARKAREAGVGTNEGKGIGGATRRFMGRQLTTRLDSAAKAAYDPRGSKSIQNASKKLGLDIGKAAEGLDKDIKKQAKIREDFAKSFTDAPNNQEEKNLQRRYEERNLQAQQQLHDEQSELTAAYQRLAKAEDARAEAEKQGGDTSEAERELKNAQEEFNARSDSLKKAQETAKSAEAEKKTVADAITAKKANEGRTAKSRQSGYASGLGGSFSANYRPSMKEAASTIQKEANKGKDEKNYEKLAKMIKGEADKGDEKKEDKKETA